jgi:TatD DNase family protein
MTRSNPAAAPLLDTHCHLDLYPDVPGVIRRVRESGAYVIAVTNTPSVFRPLVALTTDAPRVRVALGLHPELAVQRQAEMPLFESLLPETRYIGEVGLDYVTTDRDARATQRRVFERILRACAAAGDKVLTVHSRRAADDVVDCFGAAYPGRWILHWYSGSPRTLKRALGAGAWISVNSAMLRSERGRALVAGVPPDRVLTETDGPFIDSERGTHAEPVDLTTTVTALGSLWGVSAREAATRVFANFRALLTS